MGLAAVVVALAMGARANAGAVGDLVSRIPNADKDGKFTGPEPAAAQEIYAELLKGAPGTLDELIGMLAEPEKGGDFKARYVLHNLALHTTRTGADQERTLVMRAIAKALDGPAAKSVKAFLLQEIRYAGTRDLAPVVAKFLADDELCEPAAMALAALGETADAFRAALPAAKGKARVTIIQNLGRQRDAQSAEALTRLVADPEQDVRVAAIDAVAALGNPASVDPLAKAADAADPFERTRATEALLALAQRLIDAGQKDAAGRAYRQLWDARTAKAERHVRIAALQGLAAVRYDVADLLAALRTNDVQIRAAAVAIANASAGPDATQQLLGGLRAAQPEDRPHFLAILGARGDAAALPAVLELFKDKDPATASAAMQAAGALGDPKGINQLLLALLAAAGPGDDANTREATLDALAKARGRETNAIVGKALKECDKPAGRAALLRVLSARRAGDQTPIVLAATKDADPGVRLAAIRALGGIGAEPQIAPLLDVVKRAQSDDDLAAAEEALRGIAARKLQDQVAAAIVPAIASVPAPAAATLLRVLGTADGKSALEAVVAATKHQDKTIRDAAIRTLADWRTRAAAPTLLALAKDAEEPVHRVLALRGAIRLSTQGTGAKEKVDLLAQAMSVATRPEEKRQVLAALATAQSPEALRLAAASLADPDLKSEAAAAVIQIAPSVARQDPRLVRETVTKARDITTADSVKAAAKKILDQLPEK